MEYPNKDGDMNTGSVSCSRYAAENINDNIKG